MKCTISLTTWRKQTEIGPKGTSGIRQNGGNYQPDDARNYFRKKFAHQCAHGFWLQIVRLLQGVRPSRRWRIHGVCAETTDESKAAPVAVENPAWTARPGGVLLLLEVRAVNEIEKLTSQIETIRKRRQRRVEANQKDLDELGRLNQQLERATAKALVGQSVVLNPTCSISHPNLRKLRGMLATVESIGRKYLHVKFANGESWQLPFDSVVLATPESMADTNGELTDSVSDSVNSMLLGKRNQIV
jgi:hypothetical protein